MKAISTIRHIARTVILLTAIVGTSPVSAERLQFHVAFEDVPGAEQLVAGDVQQAIKILEAASTREDVHKGYVLATLCGAYLMDQALDKAATLCEQTADDFPSESSYNNRGVFRAATGNMAGALDDFHRAQPLRREEYIESLKTKDVGLIAMSNTSLVEDYQARQSQGEAPLLAEVESIN